MRIEFVLSMFKGLLLQLRFVLIDEKVRHDFHVDKILTMVWMGALHLKSNAAVTFCGHTKVSALAFDEIAPSDDGMSYDEWEAMRAVRTAAMLKLTRFTRQVVSVTSGGQTKAY
jgi:hypothetical protein